MAGSISSRYAFAFLCVVRLTRRAVGASACPHGAFDPEQLFVTRDQVIPNYPTRHESLPHCDASFETPVYPTRMAAFPIEVCQPRGRCKAWQSAAVPQWGRHPCCRKPLISQSGQLASLRRLHIRDVIHPCCECRCRRCPLCRADRPARLMRRVVSETSACPTHGCPWVGAWPSWGQHRSCRGCWCVFGRDCVDVLSARLIAAGVTEISVKLNRHVRSPHARLSPRGVPVVASARRSPAAPWLQVPGAAAVVAAAAVLEATRSSERPRRRVAQRDAGQTHAQSHAQGSGRARRVSSAELLS